LTCSEDGKVKCHNFDGDLYIDIDINTFKDIVFEVPFDWIGIKLKEIDSLFEIIEKAEGVTLSAETRRNHVEMYLNEVYLKHHFEQLQIARMKTLNAPKRDSQNDNSTINGFKDPKLRELLSDGRLNVNSRGYFWKDAKSARDC
jgi:hypothetical protein